MFRKRVDEQWQRMAPYEVGKKGSHWLSLLGGLAYPSLY